MGLSWPYLLTDQDICKALVEGAPKTIHANLFSNQATRYDNKFFLSFLIFPCVLPNYFQIRPVHLIKIF